VSDRPQGYPEGAYREESDGQGGVRYVPIMPVSILVGTWHARYAALLAAARGEDS
jgi:hypothetical protein